MTLTAAGAASAPIAPNPLFAAVEIVPHKVAPTIRPITAVLRYGPGTTSVCQSLSDNSSAICLFLALHVIELSQKEVSDTRL